MEPVVYCVLSFLEGFSMASKMHRSGRNRRRSRDYSRQLQAAGVPQLPDELLAAMQGCGNLSPEDERRADAVIGAACLAIRRMQNIAALIQRRQTLKSHIN
jgi:hypothetical protein